MRDSLRRSLVLSLLVLLALSGAGKTSSSSLTAARVAQDSLPREPVGVYAKVNIETVMKQADFQDCASSPGCDIHHKFRELYKGLLANPAISGLTIGAHWDHTQPGPNFPEGYNFKFLDDAFIEANKPGVNKSVKLIITPGVVSPKWLLDKIPSCDALFHSNELVPFDCGKATFIGFPEEQRDDGNDEIPLPWNDKYQAAWADFLGHLNDRYSSNPAFVAIAVAEPIAASDEMILPTSQNDTAAQPSGLPVDETWRQLISHSFPDGRYATHPGQAFVDAWDTTIDTYEHIFSGITLTLSPDGGTDLPELRVDAPQELAPLIQEECSRTPTALSCAAKTEVIQYFVNATCLTSPNCVNGKSTQVGGLRASSDDRTGNIGIAGVKLLTSWTPPPSPPLLGGAEFDHPVSGKRKQQMGCPDFSKTTTPPTKCPGLTVEEAAYNVMAVFFDHTQAAAYFKGTLPEFQRIPGTMPIHYLEVPFNDVEYANKNQCISQESPTLGFMTLTQLLEDAGHDLFGIANGTLPTVDTTPPVTTATLPAPTGLNGWYQGPVVINFNASDDLSGVVRTELSRDDQQTWKPLACGGLQLTDDGIHSVFARSTDLAGNVETPILTTVKIDSTAPVTTAKTQTIRGLSVVVFFAASDNLSGVARTEYSLDNGSHWKTGTTLVLIESGMYTVLFRSIDVAGNIEKRNTIKVNVNL
jgi:hypothetical protein